MKYLIIATHGGYIPSWVFCDCGSETYANITSNGKIIVCGGCEKRVSSLEFDIKFMTTNKDRLFEESING